jgi:hypothetical protein
MGESYEREDREVIICGEVLDNDELAVNAEKNQKCTCGDEET